MNAIPKRRGDQIIYSKVIVFEGDDGFEKLQQWKVDNSSIWNQNSANWHLYVSSLTTLENVE